MSRAARSSGRRAAGRTTSGAGRHLASAHRSDSRPPNCAGIPPAESGCSLKFAWCRSRESFGRARADPPSPGRSDAAARAAHSESPSGSAAGHLLALVNRRWTSHHPRVSAIRRRPAGRRCHPCPHKRRPPSAAHETIFAAASDGGTVVGPGDSGGRVRPVVRHPRGLGPVISSLHGGGPPAPVDIGALPGLSIRAGSRIPGLRRRSGVVRSVGRRSAGVGPAPRVIPRAPAGSAIGPVDSSSSAVGPRPRVVPRAHPVGHRVTVVRPVPVIRRVVPTGPPHDAAPRDHHPRIASDVGEGDPRITVIVVFLYGDVGHVVGWRAGRDLVHLLGHRCGQLPGTGGARTRKPDALDAEIVRVARLYDVLVGVHRSLE